MDLGKLTFLTVVGTQGRYVQNSGKEFARAYRLNYSRDGLLWKSWRNRLGNEVSDPNTLPRWLSTLGGEEMKEMSQEESKSEEICDGMIERRCWRKDWAGGQDNEKSRSVFHLRPLLLFTINGRK